MTNAKFYRNLVCAGLGALALGYVPLSHAAYATLSAPTGWSPGVGASATYNTAKTAAQEASIALARINANAALAVGGRTVAVPVAMPIVKEGIKKAAAIAIYAHPGLRTAAQIATWLGAAGLVYDAANGWQKPENATVSDGFSYYASDRMGAGPAATPAAAAQFWVTYQNQMNGNLYRSELSGSCEPFAQGSSETRCPFTDTDIKTGYSYVRYASVRRVAVCEAGWFHTPDGCKQTVPMKKVTQDDFVKELEPDPRVDTDSLPNIVWPASWPVKAPEVQPTFVPTGNPVKNPKYDPAQAPSPTNQPYTQPGVNIAPAPTTANPWQVDLQPVNRPVDSPNAKVEPSPNVNPDGTPKTDSGDEQRNPEDSDKQDLCEKHPDILACQKVDTEVEDAEIPRSQKTVSYQAEDIWGGGSCPADKYARVGGQELKVVDWSRDCQFITDYVRPVTLVVCALIVAGILAGALKP